MPGKPDRALASMGVYVFDADYLYEALKQDSANPASRHDFGKDVIPAMVALGHAMAHPFEMSCVRSTQEATAYWRDVGTVDAYWQANLDLTDPLPELDMYDAEWPIWTYQEQLPPAKFVHDEDGRRGHAVDSLVSGGCIVSGARVRRSVLFSSAHIHSYASVEESVLLPQVDVGERCELRRVVVDKGCHIPAGTRIGFDAAEDARRFYRTEQGVVLVTRDMLQDLEAQPAIGPRMKVLYVCTELFPLLKTGGLGDVGAALPPALRDAGCDVRVLLPGFPAIRSGVSPSQLPQACALALPDGGGPRLASLSLTPPPSLQPATLPGTGLAAYVLDVRALFDRPGNPYDDAHGDNGIRFALLGWAAACLGHGARPALAARYRPLP